MIPGLRSEPKRTVLLMVLFACAACVAIISAILLHECGHALAVYFLYQQMPVFQFDSLGSASVSYVVSSAEPVKKFLVSLSGIALGPVLGSLVFALAWPWRGPWTAPFLLAGVASLAANGFMSVVGLFSPGIRDIAAIVSFGFPGPLLFLYGCCLLLLALILFERMKLYLGIDASVSMFDELLIIAGGLVPYLLAAVGYYMVYRPQMARAYTGYGLLILAGVGVGVILARVMTRYIRGQAT